MTDSEKKLIRNSTAEFLIFTAQAGEQSIEARYEDETVWLSQKLMAELFAVDVRTVNEHFKNIYDSGELQREATIRKFRTVQTEGSRQVARNVGFYNLDAIISMGYRVNSVRATQFRQWATQVLREFAIKDYVLDRRRMENGSFLGEDYFERLLAEIREIRLSERKFYQKITDIYATAVDYNRDAPTTKAFFAKVQNKLHYAIHGHTAAELIVKRADSRKPHMGLTPGSAHQTARPSRPMSSWRRTTSKRANSNRSDARPAGHDPVTSYPKIPDNWSPHPQPSGDPGLLPTRRFAGIRTGLQWPEMADRGPSSAVNHPPGWLKTETACCLPTNQ